MREAFAGALGGLTLSVWFAVILGVLLLGGCNYSVDHKIRVQLDLEDECLTMFPTCSTLGTSDTTTYYCIDSSGLYAEGCEVRCLAASAQLCTEDGPVCTQIGEEVPVFCMAKAD